MQAQDTVLLHSGNPMPVMGLGTWMLTDDTAGSVRDALALGYRMIDTAEDYGTQPGIREALRQSDVDRGDVFVVAKIEETDDAYAATRHHIGELGLEQADLMLIHRPPAAGPGTELWQGLIRAKQDGLTRDIGVSNYSADQIRSLADATGEVPVVNQIEWSPFGHAQAMRDYCRQHGIVIQSYSPLTRAERLSEDPLRDLADRYGKTPAQLLIRWNLQLGTVPLPKANRRDHMEQDLAVFDFEISAADMRALSGLNEHYSSLGTLPYL